MTEQLQTVDLIDEYINYAKQANDAPEIFHRAVAYWLASSILGRYFKIVTTYVPKGISPNIWAMLMGPSRVVRKTTAMNLGKSIIEAIDKDSLIAQSFTPEAFYKIVGNKQAGDTLCWAKDEVGGWFKSLQKSYMAGTREILSTVYNGDGERRQLKNETYEMPNGIYFTAINTLPTPPRSYFTEEDFTSGFLNRYLLIMAHKRDDDYRIPIGYNNAKVDSIREALVEKYKNMSKTYAGDGTVRIITLPTETLEVLNTYDREVEDEIIRIEKDNPTSLIKSYISEAPTYLMKLAVLRRISEESQTDKVPILFEVKKEYVERAKADLDIFLNSAKEVISDVQHGGSSYPVRTDERQLDRVYTAICDNGSNKGISKAELMKKLGMITDRINPLLITLVEEGLIIAYKPENWAGSRGPKPLMLIASKYKNEGTSLGKELIPYMLKQELS